MYVAPPKNKKRKVIITLLIIILLSGGLIFVYARDIGPIGHGLRSLADKLRGTSLVANLDDPSIFEPNKSTNKPATDPSKTPSETPSPSKPTPSPKQSNPKVVTVPSTTPSPTTKPNPQPDPGPAPGPPGPNCVKDPAHPNLQDQAETAMKVSWRRTPPNKVSVYYETKNVPANIKTLMQSAATQWNKSACVDLHVVDSCPSNVNCVISKMGGAPPEELTAGDTTLQVSGSTIVGATITYFNGYKNSTVAHEMGHALGLLGHRATPNTLLYHESANVPPDNIDFQNLLVLYGS